MREYKFIQFEKQYVSRDHYTIRNKRDGDRLGEIYWYKTWNQYVAEFSIGAVFSMDCLDDINDFMWLITKEKKEAKI